MHNLVMQVCEELDAVSIKITEVAGDQNRPLNDTQGWNNPTLTFIQLSEIPYRLADELRSSSPEQLSDDEISTLNSVIQSLRLLHGQILINLTSNPTAAFPPYLFTMQYVSTVLSPYFVAVDVNSNSLPGPLARKLKQLHRELDTLMPDKHELESKISAIREASAAAEALPTTLLELRATQADIKTISATASENLGQITAANTRALKSVNELDAAATEGKKLSQQVSEAYRIATSVGLAASFEDRARKLNSSVNAWAICLAVSLSLAVLIGYFRLTAMKEALEASSSDGTRVWIHLLLTILGIGAPVWFAWMATKQIAQRFRLAEDYAFKASVAKAYEGYRREAVRIDSEFEKALFASALSRLDEPPLRLVETATHGSPIQEFADSAIAKTALDAVAKIIPGRSKVSATETAQIERSSDSSTS